MNPPHAPTDAPEIPKIISVDDHVVEPPDLWTSRLPAEYHDRCPRIERDKAVFHFEGGVFSYDKGADAENGTWGDWWMYDDLIYPMPRVSAAACIEGEVDNTPVTFEEIDPSGYRQTERLAAMDANHVDASLCFPNILPRFCGQAFLERDDKELALLCVQAYNDWMIDDWSAGDGYGRLIPLTLIPLWDAEAAAAEVRRCADKGSHAVAFSENPFHLGLPSIHDPSRYWDPFFQACEDTETVINMHIGSSSKMPSTSPDAPFMVSSTLTFSNAMGSLCDWVFSGTLMRFPELTIAYSEGQIGWMPYVMERMDKLWAERGSLESVGTKLPEPPTTYLKNVYGCIFDDEIGLRNRDVIGMSQITFETDYPHLDSTFPHTLEVAQKIVGEAGLDDAEIYQLMRGNAIKAFGLERFGITE
ncbi:MAG: amidohydrolase [Acidimicrobiales bacterium]|nr:amidohydrolase [Acidimicrobiales bacterium]